MKSIQQSFVGFTLVEILVVLAVAGVVAIGVLAAINPLEQIKKGRDAQRKSDLQQMQTALELYFSDTGSYPPSETLGIKIGPYSFNEAWPGYMSKIPNDPFAGDVVGDTTRHYQYLSLLGGQGYCLYAHLERGAKDTAVCNNGNRCQSLIDNSLDEAKYHCGKLGASPPEPCNYARCSQNINP